MKELKIEWLDSCPECDASVHTVHTKGGSEKWLYDGDKVICNCGQTGEIECDDGVAWVNWDEEPTMTEKLEQAKDLLESLAARKIGGTHYIMNSEDVNLAYEVFNDYVERNEVKGVDVKLPFEVSLGVKV